MENAKRLVYVFDLDGTLALNGQRNHLIKSEGWDAYFLACGGDTPNRPVIEALHAIAENYDVEIWSGRGAIAEQQTRDWLRDNGLALVPLTMRPVGDFTPDNNLKLRWLRSLREQGGEVMAVFDDRDKVVKMWRENGVVCFQVAPGDF